MDIVPLDKMTFTRALRALVVASTLIGCRTGGTSHTADDQTLTASQTTPACKRGRVIAFLPAAPAAPSFGVMRAASLTSVADDSDFSLSLAPADFDHAQSLACQGSTCQVSIVKPVILRRESSVDLAAKMFLKYEVAKDPNGAVVSRQVSIGQRSQMLSIGRILGVELEFGAYIKQENKNGWPHFSAGTYAESNAKASTPFLEVAGSIVAQGLKADHVQLKGSTSLDFAKAPSPSGKSTPRETSAEDGPIAAALKRSAKNLATTAPDVEWADLSAGPCWRP